MSADGNNCQAIGKGEVPIKIKTDKGKITLRLLRVLHAPSMSQSLVSVSAMTRAKFAMHFEGRAAHVYSPTGDEIACIPKKDGLYHIKGQTTPTSSKPPKVASPAAMAVTPTQISMTKFHRCMGHANPQALQKMISEGVIEGVEIIDKEIPICDACICAKHSRKPYPQESKTPPCTRYGERVHSDVWGPAPVKSMGGKSFYCSFIDNYTDEAVLHFMSAKSETFDQYKTYKLWAKVQCGAPNIKELQTN
jgi:hypothetical protein